MLRPKFSEMSKNYLADCQKMSRQNDFESHQKFEENLAADKLEQYYREMPPLLPIYETFETKTNQDNDYKFCTSKKRSRRSKTSKNIIYWIYDQLCEGHPCVEWVDRSKLRFRIIDQHKLATLWGEHKNNDAMDFNKFA